MCFLSFAGVLLFLLGECGVGPKFWAEKGAEKATFCKKG